MTTQEKLDLIPKHYLPQFINDDKTLISLSIPQYIGINIDKAIVIEISNSIEIKVDGTSLVFHKYLNSVSINIL